ncbi:hypothetical protein DFS33DRAFT_1490529 [Desarmillaria ectypa]|nr:hypothetical protein DFS33DRAFT_1490529 [Desarmillaria ectypa]
MHDTSLHRQQVASFSVTLLFSAESQPSSQHSDTVVPIQRADGYGPCNVWARTLRVSAVGDRRSPVTIIAWSLPE